MTAPETWIVMSNTVMAAVAVFTNLWAATIHPFRRSRRTFQFVGLLAFLYCLGYLALLSGIVEQEKWSLFFRGVSILVWPAVWTAPAFAAIRVWRRDDDVALELIARASELQRTGDRE